MLIVLNKGDPINIDIKNRSILDIKESESEDDNKIDPPEYYTEDNKKINASFVVFKRESVKDDDNLSLVAKKIATKYKPDAIGLITAVSSKELKGDIKSIDILYTISFIKGHDVVLRSFIPFINNGELPDDKVESVVVGGEIKNIKYDITFIDTAWTPVKIYDHFLTNPYLG